MDVLSVRPCGPLEHVPLQKDGGEMTHLGRSWPSMQSFLGRKPEEERKGKDSGGRGGAKVPPTGDTWTRI